MEQHTKASERPFSCWRRFPGAVLLVEGNGRLSSRDVVFFPPKGSASISGRLVIVLDRTTVGEPPERSAGSRAFSVAILDLRLRSETITELGPLRAASRRVADNGRSLRWLRPGGTQERRSRDPFHRERGESPSLPIWDRQYFNLEKIAK